MKVAFVLFFLLVSSSSSYAEMCINYTPAGAKVYYLCPEPERVTRFTWDEKTTKKNGKIIKKEIIRETVCNKYNAGSLDRRDCLKKARKNFKEKCKEFKKKVSKSTYPEQKINYKIEQDKFCNAEKSLRFAR